MQQRVYILGNPLLENTYKIGISKDPYKRAKTIGKAMCLTIEVFYETRLITNALSIEKEIHAHFKPQNIQNEWFKIDIESIISYIDSIQHKFIIKDCPPVNMGKLKAELSIQQSNGAQYNKLNDTKDKQIKKGKDNFLYIGIKGIDQDRIYKFALIEDANTFIKLNKHRIGIITLKEISKMGKIEYFLYEIT